MKHVLGDRLAVPVKGLSIYGNWVSYAETQVGTGIDKAPIGDTATMDKYVTYMVHLEEV